MSATAGPPFPDVTVLLGDPQRPDVTKVDARYSVEDLDAVRRMQTALERLADYRFRYLDEHARWLTELVAHPPAFALNFCDTGFRNVASQELHVAALLEMLDVPYSGSPPRCLAACYDKALVRAVAVAHGVPVPGEVFVRGCAPDVPLPVGFPALIKPNVGDGSVGITRESVVHGEHEARSRLAQLRDEWPGCDGLVQEFLDGPEYAIGLVGNPEAGFTVLPALQVDYGNLDAGLPHILSYESKTVPDSPYWRQLRYRPAQLTRDRLERLTAAATLLFWRLGCRDYARIDFRCDDDGEPRLLEVNPNPAWCWDGKLQIMAGFGGHDETSLLGAILEAAQRREAAARQR